MTQFLQLAFQGVALGSVYALIALAFTIVYRCSHVINFAQGALLLSGAYVISWLAVDVGLPFGVAVALATVMLVAVGCGFQLLVLRRVLDQPPLVLVMITIGLSVAIGGVIQTIFGTDGRLLGDPWGSDSIKAGGIVFTTVKLWAIGTAAVALLAFFGFDRYTRYGLAMRATASDTEAAIASGIPVTRVHMIAWGMAGAIGSAGGLFLAGFPSSPNLTLGDAALRAFPAVILGGLGSPVGAVVGGLAIGVIEVLTSGYAPGWLGANFSAVAPYAAMVAILLIRPYGFFGQAEVERL